MLTQARNIIRRSSGLSRFKLLLATASFSRPRFAGACNFLLRLLARNGLLSIRYEIAGVPRRISLRLAHLQSDLCSALELAVGDCYRLDTLGEPALVIDGGGNTGLFTLAALARWPNAQVVICEPVPDNVEILKAHLAVNRLKAELLPVCLGGTAGQARFYCREANQGSFSGDLPYRTAIEVRVLTLSDICTRQNGRDTLIKLDIEGAEVEVLSEFLRVARPRTTIVGELHQHRTNRPIFGEICRKSGWRAQFLREDDETSQFQVFSPDQTAPPTN